MHLVERRDPREASATPQAAFLKAGGWLEVWPEAGGGGGGSRRSGGRQLRCGAADSRSHLAVGSPHGGVKAERKRLMHFLDAR